MQNKLEALHIFCTTVDTLKFKETAQRLGLSPAAVTRTIAELERFLGESLFQRNTRQITLTEFGAQFLPQAKQLLDDSDKLFLQAARPDSEGMRGIVRVNIPELACDTSLLGELLQALQPWPNIRLDWHSDNVRLNVVEERIDIGIRVGFTNDGRLIARQLGTLSEKIVAAPALIQRCGLPTDVRQLENYPLSDMIDGNTGRPWPWRFADDVQITPKNTAFSTSDIHHNLQAARAGTAAVQLLEWACQPYLDSGELVELLPDLPKIHWPLYLYRPHRNVTPARVTLVFELLLGILQKRFG
ncbi:DNA-binding transcriptional regulator, LysR family [Pasteurella testudinis DSM 23072]|uniref:DNA-binding transcriptional regulator, LysR family n=1 Tax=Pasteurella testudinis DSM 23072 TaxID=1122938 RepID=A0A1W1V6U4_9PAST|nr:LysR family transcriptional regulator [Pasteurella testudinis]SMB88995.1 DNA-binding transcriptional regulator, LysR family [Pasteurella testudinis DSM 23072]SUB50235.1 glycine cleavage system transcriptional activator [Pasteurella testudinis]